MHVDKSAAMKSFRIMKANYYGTSVESPVWSRFSDDSDCECKIAQAYWRGTAYISENRLVYQRIHYGLIEDSNILIFAFKPNNSRDSLYRHIAVIIDHNDNDMHSYAELNYIIDTMQHPSFVLTTHDRTRLKSAMSEVMEEL